jgi:uncharacterized XkdX family phage protein
MSPWYDTINGFYHDGLYTDADVRFFVSASWITSAEYTQITGNPY